VTHPTKHFSKDDVFVLAILNLAQETWHFLTGRTTEDFVIAGTLMDNHYFIQIKVANVFFTTLRYFELKSRLK
jgi:hypothetical protein